MNAHKKGCPQKTPPPSMFLFARLFHNGIVFYIFACNKVGKSKHKQIKMKKLTVLMDAEIIGNGLKADSSRSGIFSVAYHVAKYLLRQERVELLFYSPKWMRGMLSGYLPREFGNGTESRLRSEDDDLGDVDCFLSPCYMIPAYVKSFPQITCFTILHDTIPFLFPQYFAFPGSGWYIQLTDSINKNDFYFAVSEHTKRDFVHYVPSIDPDKVRVTHLAADARFCPHTDPAELRKVKQKYHIPPEGKYLFSLCTLEPRKNLVRAVTAFINFIEKNHIDDLYYVLGGAAWDSFVGCMEREIPGFDRWAGRIIRAGYVADEDLPALYSHAEWFVYTSRYEGFGLPPLEAMQCGCPVIVSNNSSLPEVVGNAGIMIDCDSLEQHVQAYETYYYDVALKEQNSRKGLERARLFNWQGCVDSMVDFMEEVERRKQRQPLVTVVTVTHNLIKGGREETIRQCIESVRAQDYPHIEHIVMDGASTDGTLELLQEYASQGWIRVYSEPDKGIYDAMNKGIRKAQGEYVNFLNSDDYFHDLHGVTASMECLMKSGADYSFADARAVEQNGNAFLWKGDLSKLLTGEHYCHQTMWIKTEVLKQLGGFDLSYRVSADSDLMIRLYAQGYRHAYVPLCFLTYRIGGFSGVNAAQSRKEHSAAFFRHIGVRVGLTPFDCYLLWQRRFLKEMPFDVQLELISKVPAKFGAKDLIKQLLNAQQPKQIMELPQLQPLQYLLFGFIPLLERKHRRNKTY